MKMRLGKTACATVAVLSIVASAFSSQPYDPLQLNDSTSFKTEDRVILDVARNREIPIRLYIPAQSESAPVILFSHGLGGSRSGCSYLGKHWSARGYLAIFLQHPGSDESVWKDLPVRERLAGLKNAPSAQTTLDRFRDVSAVIDRVAKWNIIEGHPWAGRLAVESIGMSDHSYGASTTQAVSGQSSERAGQRFTDQRIKAAIMFSPNIPLFQIDRNGSVAIVVTQTTIA